MTGRTTPWRFNPGVITAVFGRESEFGAGDTEAQEASETLRQLCISRGVPFDAAKADELINKLLVP